MYQTKEFPVGHPVHSGESQFAEVQVWEGMPARTLLETFKGDKARIKAREFIKQLNWNVATPSLEELGQEMSEVA